MVRVGRLRLPVVPSSASPPSEMTRGGNTGIIRIGCRCQCAVRPAMSGCGNGSGRAGVDGRNPRRREKQTKYTAHEIRSGFAKSKGLTYDSLSPFCRIGRTVEMPGPRPKYAIALTPE